ncbi:amino acid adenylation domain-containing protein [Nocardia sp. ET3-3]|uniref:Amino acid adenylation domain-containing protein n=1 Tax=Nocardia terrae TaxID=2675851 RepID=A0A7K1UXB8_9NOCA|nr:non-ribosomal peptide synthetase [Nocardia terrae]MVU79026.1 amino acid adenylation domain-containing protein [Nocardia terrae]
MAVDRTEPAEIEDVLALSPLQQGLFSLARLAADGVDLYTMQFVIDIGGPLDVGVLRRSVEVLLERHPNLRAAFWDRDLPKPVQIVPTWVDLPWTEIEARPEEFDALAAADRERAFDLGKGPALRVTLVNLPGERRRLILTTHHILMDGWAVAVFFRELIAVYEAGGTADTLPAPRPYRDYIGWLAAQDTAAASRAWADYLSPLSDPLMLADAGAAAVGAAIPERTRHYLDPDETQRLVHWARTNGLTLGTVVQFAWAVVLSRLTDRRDLIYGTTISGRPDTLPGVETMIGLFINTVPARVVLDRTATVRDHCRTLQREQAAMRDSGYLSLSTIQRTAGHGPLFDVLFVFENAPIGAATDPMVTTDGTRFLPVAMESLVHYPLSVVSHLEDDRLVVVLEAIAEALPHLSVQDIGARVLSVLRQLPDHTDSIPDLLDVLLPAERAELDSQRGAGASTLGGAAGADGPSRADAAPQTPLGVLDLFQRHVASTPDAPALSVATARFTYRELHAAAGRLATELAARGIGPEDVVALALPRSAESIIAILATLYTGAAYVPIDISAPPMRTASILRQADPALILTSEACLPLIHAAHRQIVEWRSTEANPDESPRWCAVRQEGGGAARTLVVDDAVVAARIAAGPISAPREVHPDACAYLIFTSGSTGEPKGVMGTRAALASYFADHRDRVYLPARARLGRALRIAHAWSLSFDASWQPMIGLFDGHAVHLFDETEMRDARGLVEGIVRHRVDMIDTSPSMFAQLEAAGLVDGDHLTVLALGGEAIGPALWERLRALPATAVYNCYGPTETTVEAVVATVNTGGMEDLSQAGSVPVIGRPVDRMAGYVLDSGLRPVPRGVVGELYLSGAQLTRGYVGRAAQTADRFVADPFRTGVRMYRTGDLVRQLPSGEISYLGRADDQVKIRGYRIEIGDIESALLELSGVREAAVVVVDRPSGPTLVGFAVAEDEATGIMLRARLSERLPAYMVPARIVLLPAMPVTPNGKLDVRALVAAGLSLLSESSTGVAPRTDTERALCAAFAEVLGGRTIGIDDDFLAFGIDSIVAISLVDKARRAGLPISPAMVLATPTVRDLAATVDARAAQRETAAIEHGPAYGEVPATPIMRWMYEFGGYRRLALSTLVTLPSGIDTARLEATLQAVLDGHDMLRARLSHTDSGPRLITREPGAVRAADLLTEVTVDGDLGAALELRSREAIDRIDPDAGILLQAVRLRHSPGDVLLLTVHHLAVDPVSWHILLGDLADAWRQLESGETPRLAVESTSYRRWGQLLEARRPSRDVQSQREFWATQLAGGDAPLGRRRPDPRTDTWDSYRITPSFTDAEATRGILAAAGWGDRAAGIHEFLLTALVLTLNTWRTERGQDASAGALIAMEGHGREDARVAAEADTSRTSGWFTSVYPLRLAVGSGLDVTRAEADPAAAAVLLETVAAQSHMVPNKGLDYGTMRYGGSAPELSAQAEPQVLFDYLGRMDLTAGTGTDQPFAPVTDLTLHQRLPIAPEPDMPLRYALDLIAAIHPGEQGSQLVTLFRWSAILFEESEIDRFGAIWQRSVAALTAANAALSPA